MPFFPRCRVRRLWALPLLCCALSAHAQQRLTADQAVALALAQPHVRRELDAGVDLARSDLLAARTWSNPVLELARERGDEGPGGPSRETSVLLSQELELGGRRGLRRDAAEQGVTAATLGAEYERLRLRGEVLRAYSAAVAGERRMQAHGDIAGSLRELADVARRRHGGGDLSGYESRRIAQASAQAGARHAQAEAASRAARARLAVWVGEAALDAVLDPAPPLPPLPAPDREPAGEPRTAELELLHARRAHAEAGARAERRPALPVTLGIGRKRIEEAGVRDDLVLLELGVPLPVFDRNQAARLRAEAEADRAAAQYERAALQARGRRAAALAEASHLAASARRLLDHAAPEAERLTAIARASFAEGELDLVGLLDAYDAHADVIDQALEQQARALDALLALELLSPLSAPGPAPSTAPSTTHQATKEHP